MSKGTKNKLVPKLRFLEFKNDESWEKKLLGEISEIVRGGSPRPIEEFLTTRSDGLNWLKIGDVASDSKYILNTKERVIKDALKNTREVHPGDLILSNSMSFGRPYILKIKSCIHDGWIAIRNISKGVDTDYLYYFISTEGSQEYFSTNAAGAAVKNLNAEIIKLLPLRVPSPKEQQKIADCLSSLDELITAENQKLEALQLHKKGLMQQLFPAEGDASTGSAVPKLRFKEFRDSGEWEKKKLGDVAIFSSGGTPSKDIAEYWGGDIPWISASSMYSTEITKSASNITKKAIEDGARIAKKGTMLILVRGSMLFNRIPMGIASRDVAFNQDVKALVLSEDVGNRFLLHQLGSKETQLLDAVTATGIGAGKIDTDDLKDILIHIPSQNEQRKITDCLSSLDNLVTEQSQKVENLNAHKKGLMQQLFPNVNEI